MKLAAAIDIGQDALLWLTTDPERIGAFLGASGADPAALSGLAADPQFLGFVLDFLLASDESVLAFAASAGLPPEAVARARAILPGGEVPDWT